MNRFQFPAVGESQPRVPSGKQSVSSGSGTTPHSSETGCRRGSGSSAQTTVVLASQSHNFHSPRPKRVRRSNAAPAAAPAPAPTNGCLPNRSRQEVVPFRDVTAKLLNAARDEKPVYDRRFEYLFLEALDNPSQGKPDRVRRREQRAMKRKEVARRPRESARRAEAMNDYVSFLKEECERFRRHNRELVKRLSRREETVALQSARIAELTIARDVKEQDLQRLHERFQLLERRTAKRATAGTDGSSAQYWKKQCRLEREKALRAADEARQLKARYMDLLQRQQHTCDQSRCSWDSDEQESDGTHDL